MTAALKILLILAAFRSAIHAVHNANKKKHGMSVVACIMFFLFSLAAAFITSASF